MKFRCTGNSTWDPYNFQPVPCKENAVQFLQHIDSKGGIRKVAFCHGHSLDVTSMTYKWAGWESISIDDYLVYEIMTI